VRLSVAPTAQPATPSARLSLQRRRYAIAFLFVLPALINFTIFRYVPIFLAAQASLYDYSLLGGYGDFVWLKNFVRLLQDEIFWSSLKVSVLFALMKVPLQVVLAILLASFVAREVRGMGVARTVIFIPVVTSLVVGALLWRMMYNRDLGLLQSLLEVFGLPHTAFLSSPTLALPSLVAMMIWKEIGFSTIIFVAGLKGIPSMFYEAAAIDGAGRLRQFLAITLPLLRPVTLFVVVTQTISAMQVFIPVYVMTQGGPFFATNAVVYYVYQNGFEFSDMGYASAMSFAVLVLLVTVSGFQFRLLKSDVQY
jgi:multiple sugar transport system permease protein